MKKSISLLLIVTFFATLLTVSCKKNKEEEEAVVKTYSELIVGRWKTADAEPAYEVYNSDGTGKMWDTADDVNEDEADTFDWEIDQEHKTMTQTIHHQTGTAVEIQFCNIIILNETTLKYDNNAGRRVVTLTRVQ